MAFFYSLQERKSAAVLYLEDRRCNVHGSRLVPVQYNATTTIADTQQGHWQALGWVLGCQTRRQPAQELSTQCYSCIGPTLDAFAISCRILTHWRPSCVVFKIRESAEKWSKLPTNPNDICVWTSVDTTAQRPFLSCQNCSQLAGTPVLFINTERKVAWEKVQVAEDFQYLPINVHMES